MEITSLCRHYLRALTLFALLTGVSAHAQPNADAACHGPEISETLDGIVTRAAVLKDSQFALVVRDAKNGDILYQRNATQRLVPASTLKLLTAAAALERLGPQFRFDTKVSLSGTLTQHELKGDLYLRGSGDPTMRPEDYEDLAAQVAAAGIHAIKGSLVLDPAGFDSELAAPGWAQDDESFAFSAPVAGLTVAPDDKYQPGTVDVEIQSSLGTPLGTPVMAQMHPANAYLVLSNEARIGPEDNLSVTRDHGTNRVVVRGTLTATASKQIRTTSVDDPARYVANLFLRALQAHDVSVDGATGIGLSTPRDARMVASHRSMPLSELSRYFMKRSTNGPVEALVKQLGLQAKGQANWRAGIAVIGDTLRDLGVDIAAHPFKQVDGSGLSRYNSISVLVLSDVLIMAQHRPWFDVWYGALPVAGNPESLVGGTLSTRMAGTIAENNVHAKTGSMSGVSGLAGYVTNADQRPMVFSMLINNALASVKSLEDEVAVAIAGAHQASSQSGHACSTPPVGE